MVVTVIGFLGSSPVTLSFLFRYMLLIHGSLIESYLKFLLLLLQKLSFSDTTDNDYRRWQGKNTGEISVLLWDTLQ